MGVLQTRCVSKSSVVGSVELVSTKSHLGCVDWAHRPTPKIAAARSIVDRSRGTYVCIYRHRGFADFCLVGCLLHATPAVLANAPDSSD